MDLQMSRLSILMVETLVTGFFFWLGAYIMTREIESPADVRALWHRPGLLAGIAMMLVSIFFFGVTLQTVLSNGRTYILVQNLTWWPVPIAVAVWFRAAQLVNEATDLKNTPIRRIAWSWICGVILAYAIGVAAVGTFTDAMFNQAGTISTPESIWSTYYIPPHLGPHTFYAAYMMETLFGCVIMLIPVWWRPSNHTIKRALGVLLTGALLIFIGATVAVIAYARLGGVPEQVGDIIVAIGVAFVSLAIVRDSAMMKNRVVAADFRYSLLTVIFSVSFWIITTAGFLWLINADREMMMLVLPWITIPTVASCISRHVGHGFMHRITQSPAVHRLVRAFHEAMERIRQNPDDAEQFSATIDRVLEEMERARDERNEQELLELKERIASAVKLLFDRWATVRFFARQLDTSWLHNLEIVARQLRHVAQSPTAQETPLLEETFSDDQRRLSLEQVLKAVIKQRIHPDWGIRLEEAGVFKGSDRLRVISAELLLRYFNNTSLDECLQSFEKAGLINGEPNNHKKQEWKRYAWTKMTDELYIAELEVRNGLPRTIDTQLD